MDYERIVYLIRKIMPPLSLESTKEDISDAMRDIGINVRYSDMTHLPEEEGFIYGFVRTTPESVDIVVNATMEVEERRHTKVKLLGYLLLYFGWLPTEPVEPDLVYILSTKNHDVEIKHHLREFANEFLAPKKAVQKDYDMVTGTLEDKIKYLSIKYGVSERIISEQMFT